DPLVARTFVLLARGVHALGDVGRLCVQVTVDLQVGPVESLLLVADVLDAAAHNFLDAGNDAARAAHLAADDDAVGRREGLAGNAGMGVLGKEGIEDGIGNAVAHLVGVPFRNAFGGEDVILAGHENAPLG